MYDSYTRRQFLRQAIAAGTASGALGLLGAPRPTLARPRSPNERLNIGVIGVAAQGAYNLGNVASQNIVALCDIDARRLAAAAEKFPQATQYRDYRKLLDQKDLDAVVIATPDHSHAIPAVWALRRGLDVYCEKPLAHSVWEVRQIRSVAAENKAVTQMGTQIHAGDNYRRAVEIIQAGVIGPVRRVHVWQGNTVQPGRRVSHGTPPDHVDYDLWIGPAPWRPFDESHFHFRWRYWWDFGGGVLADMGCHYIDLPYWALELRYPTAIEAKGEKTYQGDNDVPDKMRVDYYFPARSTPRGDLPEVHLTWYHGGWMPDGAEVYQKGSAVLFEGDQGRLLADYGTHKLFMNEGESATIPPATIPSSIGHHAEWIEACKTRGPTTCNFDYSGALAETVLLGNVSYRAGQKRIEWDAEKLEAVNCPEAAGFIRREYRQGWSL
jgi:predicted dehydrogenase